MALGKQDQDGKMDAQGRTPGQAKRPSPGASDYLAGEAATFNANLKPYLPQELVGGTIPHISGMEDEGVWNAASQACGTEKVHYAYTVDNGKIWYLACPSTSLASNPDSWCPLAAALPGNSEYWDQETVYLYEQEGIASALRWDPETSRMQVFLGASRTILPRVQSMDANFVTINADIADVVPWKNKALRTERLARATSRMLVISGLLVAITAGIILAFSWFSANLIERNLQQVRQQSDEASMQLIRDANNALQSDAIKHMVRVQELLDSLSKVDGTLVKYEVNKGKVEWHALVPRAFIQPVLQKFRVRVDDKNQEKDGRVRIIGTK